jgi:hypothetical protein
MIRRQHNLKGCLKIWWFGRNNQEEVERKKKRKYCRCQNSGSYTTHAIQG